MSRYLEDGWMLSEQPKPFPVARAGAAFAVVLVIAGDSDLSGQIGRDLEELARGASDEVAVLTLIDLPGDQGVSVAELSAKELTSLEVWPEISTGDPQRLAQFWARALVSFSGSTRLALGVWGHGQGCSGMRTRGRSCCRRRF